MKKTIWTFGLISGAVISAEMLILLPFHDAIGFDRGYVVGYTTMVVAFLFIYFGVRSYRDNVGNGSVSFGRALAVGSLIAIVSSVCYTATWEVVYYTVQPDFTAKYQAYEISKLKASGASQTEVDRRTADLQRFAEMYKNPAVNAAVTLVEPLPVGLVIALVSAGVLRRRRPGQAAAGALAA
jgi:Protein of unknown function (DUF4199)